MWLYIASNMYSLISFSTESTTSNKQTPTHHIMTSKSPCILVTGGCGYVGSHTIVCLLTSPTAKYSVVVVDNLVNSSKIALDRVAEITGLNDEELKERLVFHEVDMCDKVALRKVFETSPKVDACIHFAGLKVSFALRSCACIALSPICR